MDDTDTCIRLISYHYYVYGCTSRDDHVTFYIYYFTFIIFHSGGGGNFGF